MSLTVPCSSATTLVCLSGSKLSLKQFNLNRGERVSQQSAIHTHTLSLTWCIAGLNYLLLGFAATGTSRCAMLHPFNLFLQSTHCNRK